MNWSSDLSRECTHKEKPFFTFVGEKCCNTTILDPQHLKTVGVGLTFQPFVGMVGATFKREKVTPTPTVLTVAVPKMLGPTVFLQQNY